MSELTQEFTDQLYANYQANVKFVALENAIQFAPLRYYPLIYQLLLHALVL